MPRPTRRGLPAGISRIDHEGSRTHGFFVRVGYRKTARGWRPRVSAFFGDASHGGKPSALKAAERWLKKARREVDGGKPKASKSSARSASRR